MEPATKAQLWIRTGTQVVWDHRRARRLKQSHQWKHHFKVIIICITQFLCLGEFLLKEIYSQKICLFVSFVFKSDLCVEEWKPRLIDSFCVVEGLFKETFELETCKLMSVIIKFKKWKQKHFMESLLSLWFLFSRDFILKHGFEIYFNI